MQLPLVELREGGGGSDHGEQHRRHADQGIAHGGDPGDRGEVSCQAPDHVPEERDDAPGEGPGRTLTAAFIVVHPELEAIAVTASGLRKSVHRGGDEKAGQAHHEKGGAPAQGGTDQPADRQAGTKAHEEQALLHGEGAAARRRRVVVGQQARRGRLGDGLAEAQGGPDGDQGGIAPGRSGEGGDRRPDHDRVADRARPVPPVGEVAGRHADEPVDDDEARQQHPHLEIRQMEGVLDGRGDPAHDVLVDLVDHDDETEHPHRPGRHAVDRGNGRARRGRHRRFLADLVEMRRTAPAVGQPRDPDRRVRYGGGRERWGRKRRG